MTPVGIWMSGFLAGLGCALCLLAILSALAAYRQRRIAERDRQRALKSIETIGANIGKAVADAARESATRQRSESILRASGAGRN